jgi:hypothetical protein
MRKGDANPLDATLPQFLFLKGGEYFYFFGNNTWSVAAGSKNPKKI